MKLFEAVRVTLLFSILTTPFCHGQSVNAETASKVSASVIINAPAKTVWDAIRSPDLPMDHRKVLSVGDREAVVEETFDNLPVLHSSTCIIKETETPYRRIDYTMVKSDKLKALAGAWIINPMKDGRTSVELQSSLDSGIHMPFARKIADDVAMKICRQRLSVVKEAAESTQHRVASTFN
jgi:uncharacterized protein YndB with AHSA1/START domain